MVHTLLSTQHDGYEVSLSGFAFCFRGMLSTTVPLYLLESKWNCTSSNGLEKLD